MALWLIYTYVRTYSMNIVICTLISISVNCTYSMCCTYVLYTDYTICSLNLPNYVTVPSDQDSHLACAVYSVHRVHCSCPKCTCRTRGMVHLSYTNVRMLCTECVYNVLYMHCVLRRLSRNCEAAVRLLVPLTGSRPASSLSCCLV